MTDQEFQAVYERQAGRIYKACCFYLCNPSDAQDAVQNIFIKLLEKQVTFQNEQHEMAWFYTTARNHCKDILRSGWYKKRMAAQLQPQPAAELEAEPAGNPYLEQALRQLPVKQKEVLYLYYYEEYPIREIAALLKRKESTVQTQLASGRKKLKKHLTQGGTLYGAE